MSLHEFLFLSIEIPVVATVVGLLGLCIGIWTLGFLTGRTK